MLVGFEVHSFIDDITFTAGLVITKLIRSHTYECVGVRMCLHVGVCAISAYVWCVRGHVCYVCGFCVCMHVFICACLHVCGVYIMHAHLCVHG